MGNTLTPMVAGTIVDCIGSIPIYRALNQKNIGTAGLAIASDIGILMQTATLAFLLLHRRRTVSLSGLDYPELGALRRCVACRVCCAALRFVISAPSTNRLHELGLLCIAGLVWSGVSALVLKLTGSDLIRQLTSRFAKPKIA